MLKLKRPLDLACKSPSRASRSVRRAGRGARQLAGRGEEGAQLDGLRKPAEQVAAALIAVQDLLDGAGQVVLGVAQAHVEVVLAAYLDLDQVLEAQVLEGVAVLHHQIEIGVHHARLVLAGGLEGDRMDAELLAGLPLQVRVIRRVHELHPHPPAAGHLILTQQVADLRHQGGEQGMRLGAEIAADQQRLLQLTEEGPGRVGDGIDLPLGQVRPARRPLVEPEVGGQQVGGGQDRDQGESAMARGPVAVRGPAQALQAVDRQGQEDADDAQIVIEVTQIDDPAGDRVEARPAAQAAAGSPPPRLPTRPVRASEPSR